MLMPSAFALDDRLLALHYCVHTATDGLCYLVHLLTLFKNSIDK